MILTSKSRPGIRIGWINLINKWTYIHVETKSITGYIWDSKHFIKNYDSKSSICGLLSPRPGPQGQEQVYMWNRISLKHLHKPYAANPSKIFDDITRKRKKTITCMLMNKRKNGWTNGWTHIEKCIFHMSGGLKTIRLALQNCLKRYLLAASDITMACIWGFKEQIRYTINQMYVYFIR